jgi:RNA polymerase sigma-70 factor (ECF subfamily)
MMSNATLTLGAFPFMEEADSHRPPPAFEPPTSAEAAATVELVNKAKAGDQDAMDQLFERYEARLRRWAHGRLPMAARGALDTQDLVQDTLTRVFKRLHTFEPRHPGAFRDYVWTTFWNAVRDLARTAKRRGPVGPLETELPADDPSPLQQAVGRETLDRYEAAMERLRPEEREAIVARVELGLSHAEVAQALGKPSAAAAHMAVSRALVRLAEEMAHDRQRSH